MSSVPSAYYFTTKATGGTAPTLLSEGVLFSKSCYIPYTGVDVYVYAAEAVGSVRVDS